MLKHRRRAIVLLLAIATPVLAFLTCDVLIGASNSGRLYTSVDAVPPQDVALVLGASPTVSGGRENLYFRNRIAAAADLYHAGKIRRILVSGDNHIASYDEPTAMRDALIAQGIPAAAITLDYAGFRTLDSVLRARDVFGLSRFIIISQEFHDRRALYIAASRGIDATAFVAADVPVNVALKTRLRETLARTRAVLDVALLNTKPHFPGPPQPIAGP